MPQHAREKCGVAAIASSRPSLSVLVQALRALQHRGQEAAGVASVVDGRVVDLKGEGLVEAALPMEELARFDSGLCIGHVRYSTTGASVLQNAHPVCVNSVQGRIALAHNGDIVNARPIRETLMGQGWGFQTENDSEVAVRLIANELAKVKDPVGATRNVMERLVGSYSMAVLFPDRVLAVRDPHGIRPLALGWLDGDPVVVSETAALDAIGATFDRSVPPGGILELRPGRALEHAGVRAPKPAHCMFEFVYFARADSVLEGQEVYTVRHRLGALLSKVAPVRADVVVPVPDSGRTAAMGYAAGSGVPFGEGLMKNRYVHRTFIMPGQDNRVSGVRAKLNAVRSVVRGKRVILVDDSIVRGTTMKRIVQLLRDAGALEVHVRISSPPITSPCYLGIDMTSREQLVASNHSPTEIGNLLSADSLAYLPLKDLIEGIGLPKGNLCLGCLTGEYPVAVKGEKVRAEDAPPPEARVAR